MSLIRTREHLLPPRPLPSGPSGVVAESLALERSYGFCLLYRLKFTSVGQSRPIVLGFQ